MPAVYFLIPILAAVIGWLTNVIAIKLIFRPYHAVKVPLLGMSIQGVIPKRKGEIAINVGRVVEQELLSVQDLIPHFENGIYNKDFIVPMVDTVKTNLLNRLPPFIPEKILSYLGKVIEDVLYKELPLILPDLTKKGLKSLGGNVSISTIISQKINGLELSQLESMIVSVTRKELKYIEILGAILGFLIGLVQALIIYFF
ncbi:MAG: DUF445 family protein [Bacillota bacterium]